MESDRPETKFCHSTCVTWEHYVTSGNLSLLFCNLDLILSSSPWAILRSKEIMLDFLHFRPLCTAFMIFAVIYGFAHVDLKKNKYFGKEKP